MWFFRKTLKLRDLLEGFVDVHSHLLFGVDDGAKTQEDSIKILNTYKKLGINSSFVTPHIMSQIYPNSTESLKVEFESKLMPLAAEYDFNLQLAAEYFMDVNFCDMLKAEQPMLTLGENTLLVESSTVAYNFRFEDAFSDIEEAGYLAILAHPERYPYLDDSMLKRLKNRGVMLQLNLPSLAGVYGTNVTNRAYSMLKNGYYDITGTDTHTALTLDKIANISLNCKQYDTVK